MESAEVHASVLVVNQGSNDSARSLPTSFFVISNLSIPCALSGLLQFQLLASNPIQECT